MKRARALPGIKKVFVRSGIRYDLARHLEKLEREGERPVEGVQIFTPTPMTRSTCMYHTGVDPVTGERVYVRRTFAEKKTQKRFLGQRRSEIG